MMRYRVHNLDRENVGIETIELPVSAFRPAFPVNETTGPDARPPASTFVYVFEGVMKK